MKRREVSLSTFPRPIKAVPRKLGTDGGRPLEKPQLGSGWHTRRSKGDDARRLQVRAESQQAAIAILHHEPPACAKEQWRVTSGEKKGKQIPDCPFPRQSFAPTAAGKRGTVFGMTARESLFEVNSPPRFLRALFAVAAECMEKQAKSC
jgi:hypothetical protein